MEDGHGDPCTTDPHEEEAADDQRPPAHALNGEALRNTSELCEWNHWEWVRSVWCSLTPSIPAMTSMAPVPTVVY